MSHPELKELTKAEQLFNEGKLDEALEIFKDTTQLERLPLQQKVHFQFLKGLAFLYQSKHNEAVTMGEAILLESKKSNDKFLSIEGLSLIFLGLILDEKNDKALEVIKQTEHLLNHNSHISQKNLMQRKIRIDVSKAWINLNIGEIDLAEKCLEQTFKLEKIVGNTFEIVWANLIMAQFFLRVKNQFDLAFEYAKKALVLAKEIKFNHFWIAMCHLYFGAIFTASGELEKGFKYNLKSLKLFKAIGSNFWIANLLNDIGNNYADKGDYDIALEHLEESLSLYKIQSLGRANCLNSIIYYALENDDIERAQNYFNLLENMYNQNVESHIEFVYLLSKALMLKKSPRIRDKAKAEELLKKVIETETLFFTHISIIVMDMYVIYAYVHLCDLFLDELYITNNNIEVLDELNHYIVQLLTIAEKSHSYLIFCETFILQAKLALLNFNMKAAQRFLTQAQKIAESFGLKRLAMNISNEHDELLKQSKMWKNLKESEISMSERWKLAGLREQMEIMKQKRTFDVPKLTDELPVLLLILSEGGVPFFSHSFIEEKSFKSHLFGGFLTAINSFIREMFSEGLDRAVFGEYTLVMKSIPPFLFSYIFKGDSYYALQNVDYFIDHIQNDDSIWKKLLKYYQANQSVQLKDIPLLDSLITEIFLTKNLVNN